MEAAIVCGNVLGDVFRVLGAIGEKVVSIFLDLFSQVVLIVGRFKFSQFQPKLNLTG